MIDLQQMILQNQLELEKIVQGTVDVLHQRTAALDRQILTGDTSQIDALFQFRESDLPDPSTETPAEDSPSETPTDELPPEEPADDEPSDPEEPPEVPAEPFELAAPEEPVAPATRTLPDLPEDLPEFPPPGLVPLPDEHLGTLED